MNDTERAMNDLMGYGIFIAIPLILWIIKCLIKFVLFIMFKPRWSTGILWLICG